MSHAPGPPVKRTSKPVVYVIMGVSGSGKSTVGLALANRLGYPFYDADDFHPASNIAKMRSGIPLTDQDRLPWLQSLKELIEQHVSRMEPVVLACSALKPEYRVVLQGGDGTANSSSSVAWVLLEPSRQYLQQWLTSRQAQGVHFMPATLLESQLNTLKYNVEELYMHFRPDPVTGKFPSSDEMVEDIVRHIAASNATATDSKAAS